MGMMSQFSKMTSSSKFFDVVLFLLSSLVTGPSFMWISSLVLELSQFSFIRDGPEIWKSEIPPFEFCTKPEDWGKLGIPNLAQMSPIKCYLMLQNARVTAFTISELLREYQQGGSKITPPPTKIRVKIRLIYYFWLLLILLYIFLSKQVIAPRYICTSTKLCIKCRYLYPLNNKLFIFSKLWLF